MRKPELLAPAGAGCAWPSMVRTPIYLAGTSFGMRSFARNFSPEELPEAVAFAHAHGVRVHVTVNTMPRGDELPALNTPAPAERQRRRRPSRTLVCSAWRSARRRTASCTSLHRSASRTPPARPRGMSSAQSALCWHGAFSRGDRVIRRDTPPELELERLRTGPCACRPPAAACCPTI